MQNCQILGKHVNTKMHNYNVFSPGDIFAQLAGIVDVLWEIFLFIPAPVSGLTCLLNRMSEMEIEKHVMHHCALMILIKCATWPFHLKFEFWKQYVYLNINIFGIKYLELKTFNSTCSLFSALLVFFNWVQVNDILVKLEVRWEILTIPSPRKIKHKCMPSD